MRRLLLALTLVFATVGGAHAVTPDEILQDPALEQRARDISAKLRCLVCQNQSIDDSDAELAHDLRVIVRERIVQGDTNEQVMDYVVSRYGEFVLLQPRFSARNLLLWATPAIGLLLGGITMIFLFRSRRNLAPARLTSDEQERLAKIMSDSDTGDR
ncbi:cytochrome c-type biogenesis protein [Oricola sp.]|uniref:cytochrome c-type biogenesis protein n=1 Tax=Oricola sp. TaxID=1979950 RepID=UPI0025D99505|nr:cytochrome c-type biogenesis protein [Oricola sp.]MCI5073480.1 cytochrome c-type biogenesis protein CcmH [Oricola sp.]